MVVKALIDEVLSAATSSGSVPGVAAVVTDRNGTVYEGAFGVRAAGTDVAMTSDTVVWIASMTKALTSAAAMQLVEKGQLSLDGPASDVVADLAQAQVLEGFDDAGKPQLRPASRPITLRQLLTHTAGFSYDMWSADIARYEAEMGVPGIIGCQNAALATPLRFEPGEAWDYGINIDWAGKMVEAVSGKDLQTYLKANVLEPLGMVDTAFTLGASQRERLASMHARSDDGSLVVIPFEIPQEPEFYMGGGGLYGTMRDYVRFTRAILNNGELDGERILAPETVSQMAANNIGDIDVAALHTVAPGSSKDADFFPGMACKWGLSFLINTAETPQGRSPGSLAWAGLGNTYFWIDQARGTTGALATQILPFFDDAAIGLFRAFETAVNAG